MIDLNLKGLLYTAHAALPHLLRAAQAGPRQVADLVNVSSVAGRRVGQGGGIYQLTKHGVGVFSEALRQEVTARHVRSSLVEPGATESELVTHVREEVRANLTPSSIQILRAEDIADAIVYIVTRPRHMAVNEILIRPTEQDALGDAVGRERAVGVAHVAGHVLAQPRRARRRRARWPRPGTRPRPSRGPRARRRRGRSRPSGRPSSGTK